MSQQESDNIPKKKRFSILSFCIALIIFLGVMSAIYFALFPKTPLPFLSKESQESFTKVMEKPSEIIQSVIESPQETTQHQTNIDNYNTANKIFDKIINAPQNNAIQNNIQKETITSSENIENNGETLNEIDMSLSKNSKKQNQIATNTDDFTLEPPSKIAPLNSGRRMLTEKEIKEAQKKDEQEKLKKLEELRNNTNIYANTKQVALPTNHGTLSNNSPTNNIDPVVTLFFLQDLAKYFVDNYKNVPNGKSYLTCTMPKLNQRYGVSLKGLEHDKGRKGVLDYAYHKDMIYILYDNLSPILLSYMQHEAEQRTYSKNEQKEMFDLYAQLANTYAMAIRKINAIPQLSEAIQNLIYIEKELQTEQDFFAENLLGFEQNKANPSIAHNYQENIKNSTIRSEQLRQRLSTAKYELKKYIVEYDPSLKHIPNVFELTLWLERRKNPSANEAFADVLAKFAVELTNYYHAE